MKGANTCGQGGWWGLVVVVGIHKVVGRLGPRGGEDTLIKDI